MSSNFILENPIYFGSLKVSGRVFKTATHETLATDEGFMTDGILDFYRPMAESKLPLIITGNIFVSWQGKSGGKQLALDHDDKIRDEETSGYVPPIRNKANRPDQSRWLSNAFIC
ncbi:MAG: hypothetical protein PBU42_01685 [Acinetobacter haemolyticus]